MPIHNTGRSIWTFLLSYVLHLSPLRPFGLFRVTSNVRNSFYYFFNKDLTNVNACVITCKDLAKIDTLQKLTVVVGSDQSSPMTIFNVYIGFNKYAEYD